jgi:hypothetical protein
MIIRLSQKMADKIHLTGLQPLPAQRDLLADWYGHLFVFDRSQYVIVINSATIFTVAFPGKGINTLDKFMKQFDAALEKICGDIMATRLYRKIVASAESSTQTAEAVDKHVTGCMNEQILMAAAILQQGNVNCLNLAKRLNENLQPHLHYLRPREAFLGLEETSLTPVRA